MCAQMPMLRTFLRSVAMSGILMLPAKRGGTDFDAIACNGDQFQTNELCGEGRTEPVDGA